MVLIYQALSYSWIWLLCLFTALALGCFMRLRAVNKTFERLGLPGPKPRLVFGNALDFADKFSLDVFKECVKQYGPVFGFMEGMTPSIVVACPDLSREVLVRHFDKFSNRPTVCPFQHDLASLSLLNITGKTWKRHRTALASTMSRKNAKDMFTVMSDVTEEFIQVLGDKATANPGGFEIEDLLERYILDWFSKSALGYPCNAMTNPDDLIYRYYKAANHSISPENNFTGIARLFPCLTPLLTPFDKEHRQASCEITKAFNGHVCELRKKFHDNNNESSVNMVNHLIKKRPSQLGSPASVKGGSPGGKTSLTDEEIIGEITGLLGGGCGPLSVTLMFCLYCLVAYPKQRAVVCEEIKSMVEDKKSVSFTELHDLPRLDHFIYETLRMFPVAPGVARECVETCTINGVTFERGMVVRVLAFLMYSDEKYFPSPSTFDPDRFYVGENGEGNGTDSDDVSIKRANQYSRNGPASITSKWSTFLPFGLGPRMCVGQRFSRLALKLALVRILQEFDLSSSDSTQMPIELAMRPFVAPKNGLHIKLTKI